MARFGTRVRVEVEFEPQEPVAFLPSQIQREFARLKSCNEGEDYQILGLSSSFGAAE